MKKLIEWIKQSNRWKHLAGGYLIGLCADTNYCAAYASVIAGACLEYKDKVSSSANGNGMTGMVSVAFLDSASFSMAFVSLGS